MKIGIDTFGCGHGQSGVGLYLMSLIANLPKDDNLYYHLFGSKIDKYTYISKTGNFSYTTVSIPDSAVAEFLWHSARCSNFVSKQGYDVTFYAGGPRYAASSYKKPGIVVVNEVVSELPELKNALQGLQIKNALNKCAKIIAASQFIKKDMVHLGISADKIYVVHNGINHSLFYPQADFEGDIIDIKPFAIKKPYLIYASRLQSPLKKHVELIRAFSLFKEKTGLPHRLVLAGSADSYSQQVHEETAASPYASDIFLTGYFPHEHLPQLYSNADACIVPSVNEGVGLPVLEAMACGIPVACSKEGALPEIAGSHALYFDPDNLDETAAALERIVSDKELRSKLIEGGLDWTRRFSWERTASRTLEVILSATKNS